MASPTDLDASAAAVAEKLKQLGLRGGLSNAAQPVPLGAQRNIAQQNAIRLLRERTGQDVRVHLREGSKTVMQIRGAVLERPAAGAALQAEGERDRRTARNFLRINRDLLRVDDPDNELTLASQERDDIGHHHLKFNQTFQGIPVWPSGLSVHLDGKGNVHLLDGAYVPTPSEIAGKPLLSPEDAAGRAKASVEAGEQGTVSAPALIVYSPLDKEPRLAWKLSITLGFRHSWIFIVDALDGRILNQLSQVMDANILRLTKDLLGKMRTINVWSQDGKFTMFDTSKKMFIAGSDPFNRDTRGVIKILDGQDKTPEDAAIENAVFVASADGNSWLPDAVSAAYNFSLTYDYYLEHHNRNSLDDKGGNIVAIVRIADEKHNAAWSSAYQLMIFGDDIPLAAGLDVIGHELTHGITEKTAGLIYENQPGALNEAFSDIMGEMVEASRDGQPDWQMGEEIPFIIRNFKDPGVITSADVGAYPAKMSEFKNLPPTFDHGGVHINSSIINHACYLLAEGLNGALGLRDTEKIFYRALTQHLQAQSQFVDCRLSCIASAEELFGVNSPQVLKVKEAFDAVEIFDTPATPPPTPIPTVQGPDSTLFVALDPFTFDLALGRREAAQGDGPAGVPLAEPIKSARPTVSGDGSFALFVDAVNDLCGVDTDDPNTVECLGFQGLVHAVALAPNGTIAAYVLRDPNTDQAQNKINVYDLTKDSTKTYDLLAPTADGASVDAVLYADSMVFTADGKQLIYDAVSEIRFNGGEAVERWTIYKIDLTTDTTVALFPPQEGADIGNPYIGRVSNRYLTFEIISQKTAESSIFNLDLFTGDLGQVGFVGEGLGFPCFSGDESSVIYAVRDPTAVDNGYSLVSQPLTADRLGTNGPPSLWLADASIGVVYRRGTYISSNALPQVRIVSPVDGQTFSAPLNFDFTVEASDAGGTIAKVEFYFGSEKVAEDSSPPYSVTVQNDNPTPGKLRLSARAIDDVGGVTDATPVEVTVGGQPAGNLPPQIDAIPDQTITQGNQLTITVKGTDPDPGQKLTYSLEPGAPAEARIDATIGVFTWTPSNLQSPGAVLITVKATDNGNPPMSATTRMRVNVEQGSANRAPTIDAIPDQTIPQAARLSVQISATDPDAGQTLTYSLEPGAPVDANITATGLLTWTPTAQQAPGVILITVKVTDNGQPPLSSTKRFKVTVSPGNGIALAARFIQGSLRLSVKGGDVDQIFRIEASDDLKTWKPVITLLKTTNDDVLFADPESPSLKRRFYRLLVEPN